METKNKSELFRFIINIAVICLIALGGVLIFRKCKKPEVAVWKLTQTPLQLEKIRNIAELSTVTYKDEIVVDSIEYFKEVGEQVIGNITKLKNPENWKYSIRGSAIKRQLTLIIGGEVHYGFDLKSQQFDIHETEDSMIVTLPKPTILDVITLPSKTTVFLEHGDWSDYARISMQRKAKTTLVNRANKLGLDKRAQKQAENLLKQFILTDKKLVFNYL